MQAVILAGGLGSRLKPFTEVIPKPLLPIGEKSVLEIQIEHLQKNGFDEIFLATNYKSKYIENFFGDGSRYGVKLFFSKEDKPLGTVGPITLLKEKLKGKFLVMNGDILTTFNFQKFVKFANKNKTLLTVGIKEIITPFRFGNIFYQGDFVTGIEEKPNLKTKILAGIYCFDEKVFEHIKYNEPLDMDKFILYMLKNKLDVAKYEIEDYWLDIGKYEDFKEAQDSYKELFTTED